MRTVVLGASGAVGRQVSVGLARAPGFDEVRLADLDVRRLRVVAGRLGGRVQIGQVDASNPSALRGAIRGADLVINCTTYHLGVPALRAAVAERVHYLDLGGLYNTPRQLEVDERARQAGITAVIGCGATPGLSNVLARRAADLLDRVHEIHVSFASHRDLAPSPGLLDTLLDEFRPEVARFTWRDGQLREVGPFDGARRVRFPEPLGVQEVYYVPHSETYTLPASLGDGLRVVAVRGTWRPDHMRALRTLSGLGLTSERPVRVGGRPVKPIELLRAVLLNDPPTEPGAPWAFFLHVEVTGARGGREVTIVHRTSHPHGWEREATGRMTSIPALVGAELIRRGEVAGPGVVPPERAFEPERFLAEVRRRGVRISRASRSRTPEGATDQGSVPYRRSPKSPSPGRM